MSLDDDPNTPRSHPHETGELAGSTQRTDEDVSNAPPPAESGARGNKATRGLKAFFRPAPKKGQRPKTDEQRRRAVTDAKRRQRLSIRYGGDRKKWWAAQAIVVLFFALSLIALLVATSKPSKEEIERQVAAELEQSGADFPKGQAVMWAGRVVRVWGTWDGDKPKTHKVYIAPYLTAGMNPQAGWNGKGEQQVLHVSMNPEPRVLDAHHAVVKGTYQIQDGSWHCVSVPVYAYKPKQFSGHAPWAFALSGNPTPTSCSPRTGAPDSAQDAVPDGMTVSDKLGRSLATSFFPGFFAAWGASDTNALQQYTAAGVTIRGLGGAVSSVPPPTIDDTTVFVPENGGPVDGGTYTAIVPVTWTLTGSDSQITSTYRVQIRKQGDRWYVVSEPTAAPQFSNAGSGKPASIPNPGKGSATSGNYPTSQPSSAAPPSKVNPSDGSSGDNKSDDTK